MEVWNKYASLNVISPWILFYLHSLYNIRVWIVYILLSNNVIYMALNGQMLIQIRTSIAVFLLHLTGAFKMRMSF